jgi:hypothetical protein
MRVIFFILCFVISGCTTFEPKDLKSPCAAVSNGSVVPCVKRGVNDNWLV